MVNLNQINNDTHQFITKNKKPNAANLDNHTFKKTFGKVLENMEPSNMETVQLKGLEELSPQNFILSDPSKSITDETEKLLELLELYSSKLEDNSISLKDVDTVLKEIKSDAQNLLEKVESLPDADEKIRSIAKEFVIFANTEQIKFQRGDYLS
jgi:phosphate starvation-inducible protein PhoH